MTCKLALKSFFCWTIEDLPRWVPASPADVHFTLDMEIGQRDEEGVNLFYVTIATPAALAHKAGDGEIVLADRALMVISEFQWDALLAHINATITDCDGPSWERSVEKLVRYFRWEYEGV